MQPSLVDGTHQTRVFDLFSENVRGKIAKMFLVEIALRGAVQ